MEDLQGYMKLECLLAAKATAMFREMFRTSWKKITSSDWKNGEDCTRLLSENQMLNFTKKQNSLLEKGSIHFWDLTLLSKVLLQLQNTFDVFSKIEEKQIRILQDIRNICHFGWKYLNAGDLEVVWNKIASILIYFGAAGYDLDSIKNSTDLDEVEYANSQPTPVDEVNMARSTKLKDEGNNLYRQEEYESAVNKYTTAIELNGLPDCELAILYSNRCLAYLKSNKPSDLRNARQDAKKVVLLRPTWYKGYSRLGDSYAWIKKNLKAIQAYEKALGLNSRHMHIEAARRYCYTARRDKLEGYYLFLGEWSIELMAIYDKECLGVNREIELKRRRMTEMDFFNIVSNNAPDCSVASEFMELDNYELHKIRLRFKNQAASLAKMADSGHAEAMWSLALLTRDGLGVQKDTFAAVELLTKASNLSPTFHDGSRHIGVAESENSLGKMYEKGCGVLIDPSAAAILYERASFHGSREGAYNLACLFIKGFGVNQSSERAVQYWKLSASRKFLPAMEALASHFLQEENSYLAALWFRRSVEFVGTRQFGSERKDEFNRRLALVVEKERKAEEEITSWESKTGFEAGNLTLKERICRALRMEYLHTQSLTNFVQNISLLTVPSSTIKSKFDTSMLHKLASSGSLTAQKMLDATLHFRNGQELLNLNDENQELETEKKVLQEFADGFRLEPLAFLTTIHVKDKLLNMAKQILNSDKKSDRDLNARIVCATLNANNSNSMLVFLQESVKLYPDEVYFYDQLCSCYGSLEQIETGLAEVNNALKLFPGHIGLLYSRAGLLKISATYSPEATKEAYIKFLELAPTDHRLVPESHYQVANEYRLHFALQSYRKTKEEIEVEMEDFKIGFNKQFQNGLMAEKSQLPCFLPYETSIKPYLLNTFPYLFDRECVTVPSASEDQKSLSPSEKVRLTDPTRLEIFRDHRDRIVELKEHGNVVFEFLWPRTIKPNYSKRPPRPNPPLGDFTNICIQDLDPTKDFTYRGRKINLILASEPCVDSKIIYLVTLDQNQDYHRCAILNWPNIIPPAEINSKLGFGCQITIYNPILKIAFFDDEKQWILVEFKDLVVFHSNLDSDVKDNKCIFCGNMATQFNCEKCKAAYCSKDCQDHDWKFLNHKSVCV